MFPLRKNTLIFLLFYPSLWNYDSNIQSLISDSNGPYSRVLSPVLFLFQLSRSRHASVLSAGWTNHPPHGRLPSQPLHGDLSRVTQLPCSDSLLGHYVSASFCPQNIDWNMHTFEIAFILTVLVTAAPSTHSPHSRKSSILQPAPLSNWWHSTRALLSCVVRILWEKRRSFLVSFLTRIVINIPVLVLCTSSWAFSCRLLPVRNTCLVGALVTSWPGAWTSWADLCLCSAAAIRF